MGACGVYTPEGVQAYGVYEHMGAYNVGASRNVYIRVISPKHTIALSAPPKCKKHACHYKVGKKPYLKSHTLVRKCTSISTCIYVYLTPNIT